MMKVTIIKSPCQVNFDKYKQPEKRGIAPKGIISVSELTPAGSLSKNIIQCYSIN